MIIILHLNIQFQIEMQSDYPLSAPLVNCETEIYHPNIDPTSEEYNVCLNLFDEWTESYGLRDVIQGLLFLMYNPNLEDPLSTYFGDPIPEDEFESNVRASLRGEDVDDYSFPWNYFGKDIEMLNKKPGVNKETGEDNKIEESTEVTEEDNTENNTENTETDKDNVEETKEVVSQDVTLILEKVEELMLLHPEEEEEKKEDETKAEDANNNEENNAGDEVTEGNEDVQGETNGANNDADSEQTADVNAEDNVNDCDINDNIVEQPNEETHQAVANQPAEINRQNSKLDRQCSVKETCPVDPRDQIDPEICKGIVTDSHNLAHYIDTFRTSSFVAPDYDHAINMVGAACYYAFTTYIQRR